VTETAWLRLLLSVPAARAEAVAELLTERGAASVTLQDAGTQPLYEPPPGATPLWSLTRVIGLFPRRAALDAALARLDAAERSGARVESLAQRDWLRESRRGFEVLRFGRRLAVHPSWLEPPEAEATLHLDPGLAFGTGTHPSTAMCLEWLDARTLAGRTVTDYGCGSGILALAALKLGARSALAIDIDPQALTATRANAERNGLDARVETATPVLAPVREADILLANILAGPLEELAPELAGRVRIGGRIALAGVLAGQAGPLIVAYAPWFDLAIGARRGEWVLLSGIRR